MKILLNKSNMLKQWIIQKETFSCINRIWHNMILFCLSLVKCITVICNKLSTLFKKDYSYSYGVICFQYEKLIGNYDEYYLLAKKFNYYFQSLRIKLYLITELRIYEELLSVDNQPVAIFINSNKLCKFLE